MLNFNDLIYSKSLHYFCVKKCQNINNNTAMQLCQRCLHWQPTDQSARDLTPRAMGPFTLCFWKWAAGAYTSPRGRCRVIENPVDLQAHLGSRRQRAVGLQICSVFRLTLMTPSFYFYRDDLISYGRSLLKAERDSLFSPPGTFFLIFFFKTPFSFLFCLLSLISVESRQWYLSIKRTRIRAWPGVNDETVAFLTA